MKENLKSFALEVLKKLQSAGYEAVFAGGCVRDALFSKVEPMDYDIATNALPAQVTALFPRTVPVGEAFNVILVLPDQEGKSISVEVATFRKDIGIADGRHPQSVAIATAREDVERRDFTINGVLYDPIADKVFDWVGGEKDFKAGIVKSIGEPEKRIEEDYLRMLRAIRFAARFDFKIEENLWKALKKNAASIQRISPERIYDELTKMLVGKNADRAFEFLAESGLLEFVLPEALAMKGCEQPPEFHPEGDVWVHTLLLLKNLSGAPKEYVPVPTAELAWGCLLHDIGKPPTFSHEPPDRIRFNNHTNVGAEMSEKILKRLRASKAMIEIVSELTRDHLKFKDVPQMRPSTLKRFLRNPNFPLHLEMHYLDCMASHQNLTLYERCIAELKAMPAEVLKPPPLIKGDDLIAMGYRPGPAFKKILEAIETEQLEGRLSEKEKALEFVKQNFIA